jgi:hypothetical protein
MATLDGLHEEWLQNPKYSAAYEESGLCLEPGIGCTRCAWPRGLTQREFGRASFSIPAYPRAYRARRHFRAALYRNRICDASEPR